MIASMPGILAKETLTLSRGKRTATNFWLPYGRLRGDAGSLADTLMMTVKPASIRKSSPLQNPITRLFREQFPAESSRFIKHEASSSAQSAWSQTDIFLSTKKKNRRAEHLLDYYKTKTGLQERAEKNDLAPPFTPRRPF